MNRHGYIDDWPGASYCLVSSLYFIHYASVMFNLAVFKDIELSHLSTYRRHWISEELIRTENKDHLSWWASELKMWINYYLTVAPVNDYFPSLFSIFLLWISTTFIFLPPFLPPLFFLSSHPILFLYVLYFPYFLLFSHLPATFLAYRRGWHRGPDSLRLKVLSQSATGTISRPIFPLTNLTLWNSVIVTAHCSPIHHSNKNPSNPSIKQ